MTNYGTFGPDLSGLCWSLSPNPVYEGTGSNFLIADNTDSDGENHYDINNLEPGETYYFRAFATYNDELESQSTAIAYGNEVVVTLSSEFYSENGTFIDERDGEEYSWVRINGISWMAENVRFDGCDGYNDPLNTLYYGRLSCDCPEGWVLPTKDNYNQLINYLGGNNRAGKYLKMDDSFFWNNPDNATNESLFSALPGGRTFQLDLEINEEDVGEKGYFRYYYYNGNYNVYGFMSVNEGTGAAVYDEEYGTNLYRVSVRCVKIE
jgi:uncharacterized protein (TIGR02145 family)